MEELIDIPLFQTLQEKLYLISPFATAIIDNEGKILTAVEWQELCTNFYRKHPVCEKECIKSDQYIQEHLHEANPAVSYRCPHGLIDNATPIIIEGKHLANFFIGQFFLETPDLEFYRKQARKYGFNQDQFMEAVEKVPIWTEEKLFQRLDFVKELIQIVAATGLKRLKELEITYALQKSEEKFRILSEKSATGIYIIQEGQIVYVNPGFERIFGYASQEILGKKTLREIIHPDDYPIVVKKMEERHSGIAQPESTQLKAIKKDGSAIFIEVYGILFEYQGKPAIMGTLIDITESRHAREEIIKAKERAEESEQELKASNEEYEALNEELIQTNEELLQAKQVLQRTQYSVDSIRDSIFWIDKSANIIFANQEACRSLEYTIDELLGLKVFGIDAAFPSEKWDEHWQEIIEKGSFTVETMYRTKSGKQFPVEVLVNRVVYDNFTYNCAIVRNITERKVAEKKLKLNEQRLSSIYDTVSDVIFHLAVESENKYRFISINPEFTRVTGIEKSMVEGKPVNEVIPEPSLSIVLNNYHKAIHEKRVVQWEEVSNYPTGQLMGQVSIAPIFDEHGICLSLVGCVHDITLLKKNEQELIEAKEKAEKTEAINASRVYLLQYSVTHPLDELLEETLNEAEKLTGSCIGFYHFVNDDQETLTLQNWSTRTKAEFCKAEGKGSHYAISDAGVWVDCFYERKPVIHNDYASLPHKKGMPEDHAAVGRELVVPVIRGNKTRAILGIGNKTTDYTQEDVEMISLLADLAWEIAERKKAENELIIAKEKAESKELELQISYQELLTAEEELVASNEELSKASDALKTNLSELEIAKGKAEESDRLKTAFLHNISHEIRTPLNAIMGFTELMGSKDYDTDKKKEFTDIIYNCGTQLINIVDDILAISKVEIGQETITMENVDLNFIGYQLYSQFKLKAEKQRIDFHFEPESSGKEVVISTDTTKLFQILSNLIGNALKFTHQGYVEFGYRMDNGIIEFYVRDTGIGIPQDMLDEIFNRFRQVEASDNRKYGGSGLGLSISKAYVELLGGKIWVMSTPEKGSTFYFSIPDKREDISTPILSTPKPGLKEIILKGLTALIVEDEESNYLLLEQMLAEFEHQILWARNGFEALEICKSNPNIQFILMDLKMPVMDGFEATRRIKSIYPKMPILAQSAYSAKEDINKALDAGCNDFLSKPIDKNTLLLKINHLIAD